MNKEKIEKNNELLYTFMGDGYEMLTALEQDKQGFHNDWNWIMEVVDKIESDERYDVDILQYGTIILDSQTEIVNNVAQISFDRKIDHVYDAVVEFCRMQRALENQKLYVSYTETQKLINFLGCPTYRELYGEKENPFSDNRYMDWNWIMSLIDKIEGINTSDGGYHDVHITIDCTKIYSEMGLCFECENFGREQNTINAILEYIDNVWMCELRTKVSTCVHWENEREPDQDDNDGLHYGIYVFDVTREEYDEESGYGAYDVMHTTWHKTEKERNKLFKNLNML